jgi:replication factor C subunit 2/4
MKDNNAWVEKYRPTKLDDICSQENIITALKSSLINKNIPHLIFYGPSGSGKTSTILALARDLFGESNCSNRIIELNASDERGINIIRDKIKIYAKQAVKDLAIGPPWKIIILDEADTMTIDSQFALRRIMEQYAKITRFCIICNYYNKIIDPIISRCSLCRFKPIKSDEMIEKLKYICKQENILCDYKILNKINFISRGDLRKAINLLQKCYSMECNILYHIQEKTLPIPQEVPMKIEIGSIENNLYLFNNNSDISMNTIGYTDTNKNDILNELSGLLPDKLFNEFMYKILKKDINNVHLILNYIYREGYSIINQILLFHHYIINSNLTSCQKSAILCKLAEIDQNLIKGNDEYIQYLNLIYYIMIIT